MTTSSTDDDSRSASSTPETGLTLDTTGNNKSINSCTSSSNRDTELPQQKNFENNDKSPQESIIDLLATVEGELQAKDAYIRHLQNLLNRNGQNSRNGQNGQNQQIPRNFQNSQNPQNRNVQLPHGKNVQKPFLYHQPPNWMHKTITDSNNSSPLFSSSISTSVSPTTTTESQFAAHYKSLLYAIKAAAESHVHAKNVLETVQYYEMVENSSQKGQNSKNQSPGPTFSSDLLNQTAEPTTISSKVNENTALIFNTSIALNRISNYEKTELAKVESNLISVQSQLEQTKQQLKHLQVELKKERSAAEGARCAFRLAVDDCFDLSKRIQFLEAKLEKTGEKTGKKEGKSKSGFLPSLLKGGGSAGTSTKKSAQISEKEIQQEFDFLDEKLATCKVLEKQSNSPQKSFSSNKSSPSKSSNRSNSPFNSNSPNKINYSNKNTPVKHSPKTTPSKNSPSKNSPSKNSPSKNSPGKNSPSKNSPGKLNATKTPQSTDNSPSAPLLPRKISLTPVITPMGPPSISPGSASDRSRQLSSESDEAKRSPGSGSFKENDNAGEMDGNKVKVVEQRTELIDKEKEDMREKIDKKMASKIEKSEKPKNHQKFIKNSYRNSSLDRNVNQKVSRFQDFKDKFDKDKQDSKNQNDSEVHIVPSSDRKTRSDIKPSDGRKPTRHKTILYRSKVGTTLCKDFAKTKSESLTEFEKHSIPEPISEQNSAQNSSIQLNNGKIRLINDNGDDFEASGVSTDDNASDVVSSYSEAVSSSPNISVCSAPAIPTKREKQTTKLSSLFNSGGKKAESISKSFNGDVSDNDTTDLHGVSSSTSVTGGNSVTNTSQLTSQIKSTLDSLNSIELLLRNASDSETHHV